MDKLFIKLFQVTKLYKRSGRIRINKIKIISGDTMVFIHCNNPVLRGQTLKGSIHIQTFTPYRAEKIHAELIRIEKYRGRSCLSGICEVKTVEKVLVSAENVEISPPNTVYLLSMIFLQMHHIVS